MGEPGTSAVEAVGAPPGAPPGARLGLPQATALVVGNVVGTGIFLLPASLAAVGTISLPVLAVTTVGAMAVAVVLGRLGARIPAGGGPYAYAREAFGEFAGFWTAWSFWLTAWAGNAGAAVAWVGYVDYFLGWHGTTAGVVLGLAGIWAAAAVNLTGVRSMGRFQLATTVLKFLPLVLVAVAGLFFLEVANFGPLVEGGGSVWDAAWLAAGLILFAYSGMESVAIVAERLADPARDVGRASVLGVAACGALYLLVTVAVFGTVPHDRLAHSTAPFADAVEAMAGGGLGGELWGGVLAACAIAAGLGVLNGWTLLVAEMPLAAARDGMFPRAFARLTPRGVPAVGVVTGAALTSLMLVFAYASENAFATILLFASFTSAVPYFFSAAAQLLWLRTRGRSAHRRRAVADTAVAVAALLFATAMVYGAGERAVMLGVLALLAGVPVYIRAKARRGEYGPRETAVQGS
ncbi:APC family permease [Actinomadura rayongensis]|uniref:Amino acid permease n=2 Tax=Actinomadura rayongensis TaxID=1429076 RepID=A0A6I4WD50_9ACTN|nr:amino acid permease [Actinomadura rayongensis]MXQ67638.1 amino acid permease [Actinomadura rayongensis]